MFKKLTNYHSKIKLTTEIKPLKFLDTQINTSVHKRESKLPVPWESKVSKHYKRNALLGELQRAEKVNFPLRFINSVVAEFNNNTYKNNVRNEEDDYSTSLF